MSELLIRSKDGIKLFKFEREHRKENDEVNYSSKIIFEYHGYILDAIWSNDGNAFLILHSVEGLLLIKNYEHKKIINKISCVGKYKELFDSESVKLIKHVHWSPANKFVVFFFPYEESKHSKLGNLLLWSVQYNRVFYSFKVKKKNCSNWPIICFTHDDSYFFFLYKCEIYVYDTRSLLFSPLMHYSSVSDYASMITTTPDEPQDYVLSWDLPNVISLYISPYVDENNRRYLIAQTKNEFIGSIHIYKLEGLHNYEQNDIHKNSNTPLGFESLVQNMNYDTYVHSHLNDELMITRLQQATFDNLDNLQCLWSKSGKHIILLAHTNDTTNKSYGYLCSCYYYSLEHYMTELKRINYQEAQDVKWSLTEDEFLIIEGKSDNTIYLYDSELNVKCKFTSQYKNTIKWCPFGNMIALGGFGNLAGDISFYYKEKDNTVVLIKEYREACTVLCDWSKDGMLFMTASTYPRMKVENVFKVYTYEGNLVDSFHFRELYDATWKSALDGVFKEPVKPKVNLKDQKKSVYKLKAALLEKTKEANGNTTDYNTRVFKEDANGKNKGKGKNTISTSPAPAKKEKKKVFDWNIDWRNKNTQINETTKAEGTGNQPVSNGILLDTTTVEEKEKNRKENETTEPNKNKKDKKENEEKIENNKNEQEGTNNNNNNYINNKEEVTPGTEEKKKKRKKKEKEKEKEKVKEVERDIKKEEEYIRQNFTLKGIIATNEERTKRIQVIETENGKKNGFLGGGKDIITGIKVIDEKNKSTSSKKNEKDLLHEGVESKWGENKWNINDRGLESLKKNIIKEESDVEKQKKKNKKKNKKKTEEKAVSNKKETVNTIVSQDITKEDPILQEFPQLNSTTCMKSENDISSLKQDMNKNEIEKETTASEFNQEDSKKDKDSIHCTISNNGNINTSNLESEKKKGTNPLPSVGTVPTKTETSEASGSNSHVDLKGNNKSTKNSSLFDDIFLKYIEQLRNEKKLSDAKHLNYEEFVKYMKVLQKDHNLTEEEYVREMMLKNLDNKRKGIKMKDTKSSHICRIIQNKLINKRNMSLTYLKQLEELKMQVEMEYLRKSSMSSDGNSNVINNVNNNNSSSKNGMHQTNLDRTEEKMNIRKSMPCNNMNYIMEDIMKKDYGINAHNNLFLNTNMKPFSNDTNKKEIHGPSFPSNNMTPNNQSNTDLLNLFKKVLPHATVNIVSEDSNTTNSAKGSFEQLKNPTTGNQNHNPLTNKNRKHEIYNSNNGMQSMNLKREAKIDEFTNAYDASLNIPKEETTNPLRMNNEYTKELYLKELIIQQQKQQQQQQQYNRFQESNGNTNEPNNKTETDSTNKTGGLPMNIKSQLDNLSFLELLKCYCSLNVQQIHLKQYWIQLRIELYEQNKVGKHSMENFQKEKKFLIKLKEIKFLLEYINELLKEQHHEEKKKNETLVKEFIFVIKHHQLMHQNKCEKIMNEYVDKPEVVNFIQNLERIIGITPPQMGIEYNEHIPTGIGNWTSKFENLNATQGNTIPNTKHLNNLELQRKLMQQQMKQVSHRNMKEEESFKNQMNINNIPTKELVMKAGIGGMTTGLTEEQKKAIIQNNINVNDLKKNRMPFYATEPMQASHFTTNTHVNISPVARTNPLFFEMENQEPTSRTNVGKHIVGADTIFENFNIKDFSVEECEKKERVGMQGSGYNRTGFEDIDILESTNKKNTQGNMDMNMNPNGNNTELSGSTDKFDTNRSFLLDMLKKKKNIETDNNAYAKKNEKEPFSNFFDMQDNQNITEERKNVNNYGGIMDVGSRIKNIMNPFQKEILENSVDPLAGVLMNPMNINNTNRNIVSDSNINNHVDNIGLLTPEQILNLKNEQLHKQFPFTQPKKTFQNGPNVNMTNKNMNMNNSLVDTNLFSGTSVPDTEELRNYLRMMNKDSYLGNKNFHTEAATVNAMNLVNTLQEKKTQPATADHDIHDFLLKEPMQNDSKYVFMNQNTTTTTNNSNTTNNNNMNSSNNNSSNANDPLMMQHTSMNKELKRPDALRDKCWQYVDPKGNIQGPFFLDEMRIWSEMGYFEPMLPVRCCVSDRFVALNKLFPPPIKPFSVIPKPQPMIQWEEDT